jgi:hypothetical protein
VQAVDAVDEAPRDSGVAWRSVVPREWFVAFRPGALPGRCARGQPHRARTGRALRTLGARCDLSFESGRYAANIEGASKPRPGIRPERRKFSLEAQSARAAHDARAERSAAAYAARRRE